MEVLLKKAWRVKINRGGGINEFVEHQEIVVDNTLLDFFKVKDCDFITSFGDSMEPVLKDGSICVIERNKPFKNKAIYAINTRDGLFIKQVFKQENGVILHSFNPAFKDAFYSNGDFLIIGAVIGEIRRTYSTH